MQEVEQVVEEAESGAISRSIDRRLVGGLHHFEVPRGELVPEETIHFHEGFGDAVFREQVGNGGSTLAELCGEPLRGLLRSGGLREIFVHLPSLNQAESVPNLVAEITTLLTKRFVEEDVVAGRCGKHHAHAHTVCAKLVDEIEGVGGVAQRLRHFATQLVTNDTGEVDILERHLTGVLIASHNHARHPEENNIRAGYEVAGGVIVLELGIVGMIDAVEQRNGPKPRREPGVECIFVLTQIRKLQVLSTGLLACQLQSGFCGFGHHKLFLFSVGGTDIVGRNAMSPPQLTADAPVLDVAKPVLIGVFVLCGIETNLVVHHGRQGEIGKVLHAEIPLHAKTGFNGSICVTFRITHFIVIVFHFLKQACGFKILGNLFTHGHTILTDVHSCGFRERSVGIEDINRFEIVLFAEHIVVRIVGGRDFQTAGTEFDIDIAVFNDRNHTIHEGDAHLLSLQPTILRILGVNAHGRVAHNGFGARGCDNGIATFLVTMDDFALNSRCGTVISLNIILEVVEFAFLLAIDHLFVGECGLRLGIPVDHTEATIDQPFVEEINKDFDHAFAARFVHREGGAIPIARSTELTKLLENDAAVLFCPIPGVGKELFARQITLANALFRQFIDHFGFSRDRSVVSAGHPASILAFHASTTHENILNRVVQNMSHVQNTSNIGGRNDNRVRPALVGLRTEKFMVGPVSIPLTFHCLGGVFRG